MRSTPSTATIGSRYVNTLLPCQRAWKPSLHIRSLYERWELDTTDDDANACRLRLQERVGMEGNGKATTSFYCIHAVLTNFSPFPSNAPRHRRHCQRVCVWDGGLISYIRNTPTCQPPDIPFTSPLVQCSSRDENDWIPPTMTPTRIEWAGVRRQYRQCRRGLATILGNSLLVPLKPTHYLLLFDFT